MIDVLRTDSSGHYCS